MELTQQEKDLILNFFKEFSITESDYDSTVTAAGLIKKLKETV